MTFSAVPATAFVDGVGTIPSSALNYWRQAIAQSIDGTGGSGLGTPYTPAAVIAIRGAGLNASPLSAVVPAGNTLEIGSGGTLISDPGATIGFNSTVTFSGDTLFTGPDNVVQAGEWTFLIPVHVVGGAQIRVGDTVSGQGSILVEGAGAGTGSNITVQGVSAFLEMKANTTLLVDSGAAATLNGAVTLGTDGTTQTGAYVKQGASATTADRVTDVDPNASTYGAASATIYLSNVLAYDEYRVVSSGSVVLPDPTGLPSGAQVRFFIGHQTSVYVDFYPFFPSGGPLSTPYFRMNGTVGPGSNGTPQSQNLACVWVSFRVKAGTWEINGMGGDGSSFNPGP